MRSCHGDHSPWGAVFCFACPTGRQDTSEGVHKGSCTRLGLGAVTAALLGVLAPCIPAPPSLSPGLPGDGRSSPGEVWALRSFPPRPGNG